MINDEGVAELHGDSGRRVEDRRTDGGGDARSKRIVEIHDDEGLVGEDVSERSGDGDAPRSGKNAAGIEGQRAMEKIVGGIAVEKSADARTFGVEIGIADDDQAFFFSAT